MAAFVRIGGYHLIRSTCRHQLANLNVVRNVKCILSLQHVRSLSIRAPLFCTGVDSGANVDQTSTSPRHTQKIFTGKDFSFGMFIGKKGSNISKLRSECGDGYIIQPNGPNECIIVSGTDAEGVKSAAEKVDREVQRIKNLDIRSFCEKVLTDKEAGIHEEICGMVIGKGRENMKQYNSEFNFVYDTKKTGHILVFSSDAEVAKKVAEMITRKVNRIKEEKAYAFTKTLLTDQNADIHRQICGKVIGKGGHNINRTKMNFGPSTYVTALTGQILVSGEDDEEVNRVAEQIQRDIQTIKDTLVYPFQEKVLTDEDINVHRRISSIILGRGGENFKHLKAGSGLDFNMDIGKSDHVLIHGKDSEVLKKAVEKMEREIEKARIEIIRRSCMDSFHDWSRLRKED